MNMYTTDVDRRARKRDHGQNKKKYGMGKREYD